MSPKWGEGWAPMPGNGSEWRSLRQRHHWAEVKPDGTWSIFATRGRKNKIAAGSEGNPDVAKRVIREWEDRHA